MVQQLKQDFEERVQQLGERVEEKRCVEERVRQLEDLADELYARMKESEPCREVERKMEWEEWEWE